MADTEQLPNECAVCSTPCVGAYCSENCYLMGTSLGFACKTCLKVCRKNARAGTYFCSQACSAAFKKAPPLIAPCGTCGTAVSLEGRKRENYLSRGSAFCSTVCSRKSRGLKIKQYFVALRNEKGWPTTLQCKGCGTVVETTGTDECTVVRLRKFKARGYHVCVKCVLDARTVKQTATCRFCGKEMDVTPTRRFSLKSQGYVFCDISCAAKHRSESKHENPTPQP